MANEVTLKLGVTGMSQVEAELARLRQSTATTFDGITQHLQKLGSLGTIADHLGLGGVSSSVGVIQQIGSAIEGVGSKLAGVGLKAGLAGSAIVAFATTSITALLQL